MLPAVAEPRVRHGSVRAPHSQESPRKLPGNSLFIPQHNSRKSQGTPGISSQEPSGRQHSQTQLGHSRKGISWNASVGRKRESQGFRGGALDGKEQPRSLMDEFHGRTEIIQLKLGCTGIPAMIPCFAGREGGFQGSSSQTSSEGDLPVPATTPGLGHLQPGVDALKPPLRDGLA